jgi:tRNA U34 5-methylaminomethyl-2-thiouridine-forming methyltransferase MnmC
MTDQPEHRLSKDGSSTLYSPKFEQYYHNPNGALSESRHVFFQAPGLMEVLDSSPDSLTIFEMGFGTGLNFLILADEYFKNDHSFPVHFYSVEAYPVQPEISAQFNFGDLLNDHIHSELIEKIFSDLSPGLNTLRPFPDHEIYLHLFYGLFDELETIDHKADFIFHDPFSPEVNEELWQPEIFSKLKEFSKPEVVLATYCAASKARAAMAKAGWLVSRAPGALGKREMTVASFSPDKLTYKRVNEKRLKERWDSGDFK